METQNKNYNSLDITWRLIGLKYLGIVIPADEDLLDAGMADFLGNLPQVRDSYISTIILEFEENYYDLVFASAYNHFFRYYELSENHALKYKLPNKIYFKFGDRQQINLAELLGGTEKFDGFILPETMYAEEIIGAGGCIEFKRWTKKEGNHDVDSYFAGLSREYYNVPEGLDDYVREKDDYKIVTHLLKNFSSFYSFSLPYLKGFYLHSNKENANSIPNKIETLSLLKNLFLDEDGNLPTFEFIHDPRIRAKHFEKLALEKMISGMSCDVIYEENYDEILNDNKKIAERIWDLTETYPFVNGYVIRFGKERIKSSGDLKEKLYNLLSQ